MRKYILIIAVLLNTVLFAQNPGIKSDLSTLIPPSPTVAALMKYEEIPVNNYTGVPNISIPLYNYSIPSSKIGINVGLSYHTASTKLDEVASDIGLGWSLTCSGSISRTVRGIPDELYEVNQKFGVYKSNTNNGNNYYQTIQSLLNTSFNPINSINYVDNSISDNVKEFLFETNTFGKYDTQHDLWQYNFNGHTGRFYIEKQTNGNLEVKLLSNDNLKIINQYNQEDNIFQKYKPTGFTVYDESGYKYIFDVIETTNGSQFTESTAANGMMNMNLSQETYNSAFHLSKIYDNNNKLLVEYVYFDAGVEHISNSSFTSNYCTSGPPFILNYSNLGEEINYCIEKFDLLSQGFILDLYKPTSLVVAFSNTYTAKKISEIKIIGVGKVNFEYQTGRNDENYTNSVNVKILKGIKVKQLDDSIVKSFYLDHEYKYAITKKLFLKGVKQLIGNGGDIDLHKLYYKEPTEPYNPAIDNWGFLKNDDMSCGGLEKKADKDYVSSFVLEKMTLPTGGCVVFNYESNTYAYLGAEQLTNFDSNFYNWDFQSSGATFYGLYNTSVQNLFTINVAQDVCLQASYNFPESEWYFSIYKDAYDPNNPTLNLIGGISSYSVLDSNGFSYLRNVQPGTYVVRFSSPNLPTTGMNNNFFSSISAHFRKRKIVDYKNYFYGGGFRISKISTFNENIIIGDTSSIPLTIKEYSYNDFDNNTPSSGVLVSKEPLFKFETSLKRPFLQSTLLTNLTTTSLAIYNEILYTYSTITNRDKINRGKTNGADIGYKNVTIKNSNNISNASNGKTQYTYTTSLEYPNIEYTFEQLYLPSINMDYKRGLLKKEEVFDVNNKRIVSTVNNYDFTDSRIMTGLHVFGTWDEGFNSCPSFKLMINYNNYKTLKANNCNPLPTPCGLNGLDYLNNIFNSGLNIGFTGYLEAYGWAKLASKTTQNYFYPNGGTVPNIVTSNETFTYNPINKQIASQTVNNSVGETLTTNYFYHPALSQNRISEIHRIETKRGSELLSESKINYSNTFAGNQSFLPSTIEVKKGNSPSEIRLRNNVYDEFGHVLEMQQESGMKISYIYGYNKSQPVAKLENIAYSAIPNALITAIQTATNNTAGTEAQVIAALNALRTSTDVNLKNAMITTLTYKPLIGVSTVTDPKGDKQTYHYDSFNRLEFVKDRNGNILSENTYHYKN
jgi:hypothetical protein